MLHCSSTSLGVGGGGTAEADDEVQQQQQRLDQMEMAQQKRGNKQLLTTTTTTTTEKKKDATRLMLLFHLPLHVVQQLWHRGRMAFGSKAAEQQQPQRHVWHSSAGTLADEEEEEAQEADDEATTTEEGGGGGQADGLLLEQQHRPGATAGEEGRGRRHANQKQMGGMHFKFGATAMAVTGREGMDAKSRKQTITWLSLFDCTFGWEFATTKFGQVLSSSTSGHIIQNSFLPLFFHALLWCVVFFLFEFMFCRSTCNANAGEPKK